jgi:riboflavin transporter FmnP
MNSKKLALITIFAAVSLVLNPFLSGLVIPSFFPGLYFQFWEIPVVAALLILGLNYAVLIALLDTAVLIVFYPGPGFNAPLFNCLALLSTILGVYMAHKLFIRTESKKKEISKRKQIILSTSLGMIFREVIMIPAVYLGYRFLSEIFLGITYSDALIISLLPVLALYDATVVLYTVPTAYLIEKIVKKNLRIDSVTKSI